MNTCAWKSNWAETRDRFAAWWRRAGLLVDAGVLPAGVPHAVVDDPEMPQRVADRYRNADWRARHLHAQLARHEYPADALPIAMTCIGPGSLALFLGSEPGFSEATVWFNPIRHDVQHPETLPPLRFDPGNRWWRLTEATCRACADAARGRYLVGCPDLVENIDILAALRDPQALMMDLIERPGWVLDRLDEINQTFFEAYRRVYEIIGRPDGSSTFGPFRLWGPGKTAKVQCDASAMFSPEMFARFVVPALTEQCAWLDHSMFHLDGTQCMAHLDLLLSIDALDAIEWTPQPGVEGGGHPRWYDLYRRILSAGKSVQAIGVHAAEVAPLLDAIGTEGVYVICNTPTEHDVEAVLRTVEDYR